MDTKQEGRSERFTTNYNTYNEQSLNKCQESRRSEFLAFIAVGILPNKIDPVMTI
jgi:hypothetical protein